MAGRAVLSLRLTQGFPPRESHPTWRVAVGWAAGPCGCSACAPHALCAVVRAGRSPAAKSIGMAPRRKSCSIPCLANSLLCRSPARHGVARAGCAHCRAPEIGMAFVRLASLWGNSLASPKISGRTCHPYGRCARTPPASAPPPVVYQETIYLCIGRMGLPRFPSTAGAVPVCPPAAVHMYSGNLAPGIGTFHSAPRSNHGWAENRIVCVLCPR